MAFVFFLLPLLPKVDLRSFKALRISFRSCTTSGQTLLIFLFSLLEFPKGWLNRSLYKSWAILSWCDASLPWIKNPSVSVHNTIDLGKKLLVQVSFLCFEIHFQTFIVHKTALKHLSTLHKQKPLPFSTVYWCDGIVDYFQYYLYFQFYRHSCFESFKKHPK